MSFCFVPKRNNRLEQQGVNIDDANHDNWNILMDPNAREELALERGLARDHLLDRPEGALA